MQCFVLLYGAATRPYRIMTKCEQAGALWFSSPAGDSGFGPRVAHGRSVSATREGPAVGRDLA